VHALTASVNYEHRVKVDFPRAYTKFTVTVSDDGRSLASTILAAFKTPREYGVDVVWPYASTERHGGDLDPDGAQAGVDRKCLVRSEEGWWSDWRGVVREAIKANRQGWVGLDDWMEMAMRPVPTKPGEAR